MTNEQRRRPLPPPQVAPVGDPLLAERLARLAERSAAARGGSAARPATGRTTTPAAGPSSAPGSSGSTRRRHAAKGSRLAALAMSLATTGGLTAAFARADAAGASGSNSGDQAATLATQGASTAAAATTAPEAVVATAPAAVAGTTVTPGTVAPQTTAAATTVAATGLVDGTYVGASSSNRFGNVQVQVTVAGGTVTDVTTLQYPDGDRKSIRINQQALPKLQSRALSAQSAQINGVSGATYTSRSYVTSLQSALDQALVG